MAKTLLIVFFTDLQGMYSWDPKDEAWFEKAFDDECSIWLRHNLYNARKLYNAPFKWMTPEIWQSLLQQWETEEFKKKSAQNKANREGSGDTSTIIYRGGSVRMAVHEKRLVIRILHSKVAI